MAGTGRPRFVETTRRSGEDSPGERGGRGDGARRRPVLVLAHHPRLARAGERIELAEAVTAVSRLAPSLIGPGGQDAGPLDDPYVSRQPFVVRRLDRGIELENAHGLELVVGGVALAPGATRRIPYEDLERGVDLVVAGRVLLWLMQSGPPEPGDLGLLGASAAIRALRAEIRAAAAQHGPILVGGETGAGKELVARALHAAGPRAGGPFVAVNVAAIPAAVAAAELFGHEKGAFTGAGERRAGYFERAAGGVLFLDEIGELPEAIQPLLLRALESGEIQTVGGQPRRVDVRVVAATDADLPAAVAAGRFRGPLYYRLAGTAIRVPPLRERESAGPLLLARFLAERVPEEAADHPARERPWLPAALVAELAHRRWPGNVRELRAAAARLAAVARAGRIARPEDLGIDGAGADIDDDASAAAPGEPARGAGAITEDRLVAALREHRFQLGRTAEALGISRTHLDARIARSARLRKAKDLTAGEITACAAAHGDDLDAMAAALEVSPRGLRLRMRQLGL
ncbi:MAG TPA: sigma 54-interacting transcriptional regulator [Kofleriaceae bacterium]|nr:sigma 54-interacting transcriptional regulator [Kofleriaceae bacterium]